MEHITLFTDILPEEQGKNACLFSRKRDDIPEWRNDYGIFQFHEKNRV